MNIQRGQKSPQHENCMPLTGLQNSLFGDSWTSRSLNDVRDTCETQIPRSQSDALLYRPHAFVGDRNNAAASWSQKLELDIGQAPL